MRLDRKFLAAVAASLLWALLVAAVFYRVSLRAARPPQARKPLVIAVRDLAPGAAIAANMVRLTEVPPEAFPKGGFSRLEEVVNRPVAAAILPDEPVTEARLAARGSGVGLAPLIPAGKRAVAVKVNEVVGVAGFVLPGMRVDVLVTGRAPGRDDTATRTVLQNVTVLSAGQAIQTDGKNQTINAQVVTLLVNPEQAEVLALASNEGRIQLALRNSADERIAAPPGTELRRLYGVAPPPPAAAAPRPAVAVKPRVPVEPPRKAAAAQAPAPPSAGDTVVVFRGGRPTVEAIP
ncbi:MAG: Flp pilus assembly protein CpaB [Bryobacteraceae bacterium]